MPKDDITQQFIEACNYLLENNLVKNKSRLAYELGLSPQSFSEIIGGRRTVHTDTLQLLFKKFNINYNYVFFGELPLLNEPHNDYGNDPAPSNSLRKRIDDMNLMITELWRDNQDLREENEKLKQRLKKYSEKHK
jgi:hypothetical protein